DAALSHHAAHHERTRLPVLLRRLGTGSPRPHAGHHAGEAGGSDRTRARRRARTSAYTGRGRGARWRRDGWLPLAHTHAHAARPSPARRYVEPLWRRPTPCDGGRAWRRAPAA